MTGLNTLDDKDLFALLQQGRLGAFKEIYTRYWKQLYSEAYKRLQNRESAEEIAQEIFTTLWHKRTTLNINQNLAGYLFTSVTNLVIDYHRKELVRERHKSSLQLVYSQADTSMEDALLVKELQQSIDEEVKSLPDKCRSVFQLSRIEHKSNKEIASELGISEKTVENHITKALKHIRLGLGHYASLLAIFLLK
ncbi:RNA polymerase sigma-70 factor [Mucilaginibacter terrenus]|uniref:RNA polymerase sigma-70 factor n=1 Tax=Mucilaginibacter terrenus TaxID=2482727 RepID=A0A3E2NJG7_9SPHI|nr:RNA polymerase sigma-70 factor [Mucilaginibacter terrenus]RFZ81146.1 RNA polymerase sigma-70 factor [Mucilaginibacter terrenus]